MAETVKGLNIKIGLNTAEIDSNLKNLSATLKSQEKDLRSINAKLRYDPSNVDAWREKQEKLNSILQTTSSKLVQQNKKLEEAKKALAVGAISEEEFNKVKRSVNYAEADVAKFNQELEKTSKKITELGNVKFDKLAKVGSSLTKYVTLPIMGAVTALTTLSMTTANTIDDIADSASKIGVSIEALQEWQYVSKILGSTNEAMNRTFVKINTVLGEIASGNGEKYSEALGLIGLSIKDLKGLSPEKAFELIRNALSQCENAALRTKVANTLLGEKLAAEVAPILSATTDDVQGLKNQINELGVVSEEEAAIAGEFNDSLDNLKIAFRSLSMTIASGLLPVLQSLVNLLTEKAIPKAKELIEKWNSLSDTTKKVIGAITGIVVSIGPLLAIVGKAIPAFIKLKTTLKASAKVMASLGSKVSLATLGWGALIAVIAVLLLKNESFRALLKEILNLVGEVLKVVGDLISNVFEALMPIINDLLDLIDEIITELVGVIKEIMPALKSIIGAVVNVLKSLMPIIQMLGNLLTELLVPVIKLIKTLLEPIIKIISVIIQLVSKVIEICVELINSVLQILIGIIQKIMDILGGIIDLVVTLLDIVMSILTPVLELLMTLLEPVFNVINLIADVIQLVMDLLKPLIDILLMPLMVILEAITNLVQFLAPLLKVIGQILQSVIMPILDTLYKILKPILDVITGIVDGLRWVVENVGGFFDWIGDLFTGELFKGEANVKMAQGSSSNSYDNSQTTNNVTINTSGDVDIDSINEALGGAY